MSRRQRNIGIWSSAVTVEPRAEVEIMVQTVVDMTSWDGVHSSIRSEMKMHLALILNCLPSRVSTPTPVALYEFFFM
jgi:hypothetical protein